MSAAPRKFDPTAWQRWQEAPWGRLRYAVAEANLVRHLIELGPGPLRVLDLAGGDGGDAVRLAARGHHVTIVDRDPAMLEVAVRRAAAAGLPERISCVEADVMALPSGIAAAEFDVVLCHNLLQYVADVGATLAAALEPLRPGGHFSIMAVNRHSEPLTVAARQSDPGPAYEALDADRTRSHTFGATLTLYTAEEITRHLADLGCPAVSHYGIRGFCDYIPDDERKHAPAFYAELERLELAVTDRAPYKHIARLFQLIGTVPRR
ncbi:class I SAM-dependent methyltransferase [Microtetraspora malaysiensis]|uniref:class I SAM-dependent methyltransferase n=1 Tax=Microtetraspora malaysiensis TaxID=161358 RepID=UPI003D8AE89E